MKKYKQIKISFYTYIREKYCLDFLNALLNEAVEELKNGKDINITLNKKDMELHKSIIQFELKIDNYEFLKVFCDRHHSAISLNGVINYLLKYKISQYN